MEEARPEVSIVMPCLDEAETLAACIAKAREAIERHGLKAEIVVADNGSRDGSPAIARAHGARCVGARERGYGAALRAGIAAAEGDFVVMGDADDSYDFRAIEPFLRHLRAGADLVVGCRVARGGGRILPGAMPWSHRWIGVPLLSGLGRMLFGSPVRDFHCGLRAFRRDAILGLDLRAPGMEFASEMVIRATLAGWRIAEVPITLSPAGRTRPSHLRAWRDGWRHLFLLLRLRWAAPRRHRPGASDGMKPLHQSADRDQGGEGGGAGRQRGEAAFGEE
jgi:glycosyltransferase involved in cell wall biosynthesis